MKIDLTNDEYRTLLDVLSIANFVLEAGRPEPDPKNQTFHDLEQKLFSYASVFGAEDLVAFYPDRGEAIPTETYERSSKYPVLMDDYNDFIFWEELVARLAEQDLLRDFGVEGLEDMSLDERIRRDKEYEKPYWDEFEKHGLERVSVLKI